MQENSENLDQVELREKSHAWQARFDEKLDEFFESGGQSREELMDLVWEYGIMDRIAPEDVSERDARKELGSAVWEGDRDDPSLYWRIMYAAANSQEAIEKNYSVAASGRNFIVGALNGIKNVYMNERLSKFFPDYQNGKDGIPENFTLNYIIERSKQELEKRGVKPPEKLISLGAKGRWHGVEFTVDSYTDQGKIWPKVENREDHMRIFDEGGGEGIPPEEIERLNPS